MIAATIRESSAVRLPCNDSQGAIRRARSSIVPRQATLQVCWSSSRFARRRTRHASARPTCRWLHSPSDSGHPSGETAGTIAGLLRQAIPCPGHRQAHGRRTDRASDQPRDHPKRNMRFGNANHQMSRDSGPIENDGHPGRLMGEPYRLICARPLPSTVQEGYAKPRGMRNRELFSEILRNLATRRTG
jgi:hypothetical protein